MFILIDQVDDTVKITKTQLLEAASRLLRPLGYKACAVMEPKEARDYVDGVEEIIKKHGM